MTFRTSGDVARNSRKDVKDWSRVKIEFEGHERFATRGAKEIPPRIEKLAMEFRPAVVQKAGAYPAELLQTLCANFSSLYRIEPRDSVKSRRKIAG